MEIIKRNLFQKVLSALNSREIILIIGPRQCGKTTLMKLVEEFLKSKKERTIFLNLDFEEDKKYFETQKKLIDKLDLEFDHKKAFVFIDEIQRKENAGIFLKGIYDLNLPYKFIISGSGSLELKEKVHESLAGRKLLFEMFPLTLDEFINYKTHYAYEKKLHNFIKIESEFFLNLLDEYLNFGGYPRCVFATSENEKKLYLDEIYKSYIEKDISYWLNIDRVYAFKELIKYLSFYTGKIINYSEIASKINISLVTLKNYIYYAQKTFIIDEVRPYFKNPLKELVKSPVIYFNDIGLKNYISGRYNIAVEDPEKGFIFQNLVFNVLRQKTIFTPEVIKYWRTKDKAEVDFIIDKGNCVIPIEVKYAKFKKANIPYSLISFIKRYSPEKAYIINLNLDQLVKIDKTEVNFISFSNFLFEEIS